MAEVMETKLIPEATKQMEPRKRAAAPGTHRITVTLNEDEYHALLVAAAGEMREPNNMLSYALKGRIVGILADYQQ